MKASVLAIHAFWLRMWFIWVRNFVPSLTTNAVNPVIFLFAFSFGLGSFMDQMGGVPYALFVVPGMMVQAVMFTASFEGSIEAFWRFQARFTWNAILATPLSLKELLFGEMAWGATKAMIACTVVALVGGFIGGVHFQPGALLSIPFFVLGAFCFSVCGLVFCAYAKDFTFFGYFFTFWFTPQFMFCGLVFPIDRFPDYVQMGVQIFPAYHVVEVIRPMISGQALDGMAILGHTSYIVALTVAAYAVAYRKIGQRLFD